MKIKIQNFYISLYLSHTVLDWLIDNNMFTFLYKQHQRLQKEREGLLGWPQSWLTLIPSEEPSNGTKGFWTAGCHGGISPNAGAVGLWSEHQCGPGSSCWERRKLRPTPSRGSANPLKNREWVKGITMNTLKKNHSRRPWEAQVASVVGPILSSSSFCSLFSPCSKNLLKSAGYSAATHKGRQDGGPRLLQNSFVTTGVAQTWPKTHSPLG